MLSQAESEEVIASRGSRISSWGRYFVSSVGERARRARNMKQDPRQRISKVRVNGVWLGTETSAVLNAI
jgi:hypothetical protein